MANADQIIGANLRALREYHDVSQSAVAAMLGVTFQQVQKYETGRNRLTAERLHRLACYFGVPSDNFFHGLDDVSLPAMDLLHHDPCAVEALRIVNAVQDSAMRMKMVKAMRALAE